MNEEKKPSRNVHLKLSSHDRRLNAEHCMCFYYLSYYVIYVLYVHV